MDYNKLADLLFPDNKYTVEDVEKMYPARKLPAGAQVVRFAPSPTGYLHLGHFFQAITNKFLALQTNGVFYFRLEDTDKRREVAGADKLALQFLDEYNLGPDEGLTLKGDIGDYGPYRQSERGEIYRAYAKRLVEKGRAFPCFCDAPEGKDEILENREKMLEETSSIMERDPCRNLSFEEIENNIKNGKAFALRLLSPNKEGDTIKVYDLIKGEREIPANLKDVVLIKKDGIPPYPFAHPIDDHLMGTTIVVRGEDWFSSVNQHIDIFNALDIKPMNYIHTPLICKIDAETGNKRKLSKRKDPENNVFFFKEAGYPNVAVLEYLLNLANSNFENWRIQNPTADIFSFPFNINKMSTGNPMFDLVKLNDISKNVISRMTADEVYNSVLVWAEEFDKDFAKIWKDNKQSALGVLAIGREGERPRKDLTTFADAKTLYSYMFKETLSKQNLLGFDEKVDKATIKEFLTKYLSNLDLEFDNQQWFNQVKEIAGTCGFATDNKEYKANPEAFKGNVADACALIRIAITGTNQTPDLCTILKILGKEEVKSRLEFVIGNL